MRLEVDMTHPTRDHLEAYCGGTLAEAERAAVGSHVDQCSECRAEVEDWQAVFTALSALPRFAPRAGFADRIMARVRIPVPWHARAGALVIRAVPQTTRGWALVTATLSVPVIFVGGFLVWLLSKSYVTAQALWIYATDRFAEGANQVTTGAISRAMESDVAAWLVASVAGLFEAAGIRGVGAIALGSATLVVFCTWILYRYLFRSPMRGSTHGTHKT